MAHNASNLAELIPHHAHSSLDGLTPVVSDPLRAPDDRYPTHIDPLCTLSYRHQLLMQVRQLDPAGWETLVPEQ